MALTLRFFNNAFFFLLNIYTLWFDYKLTLKYKFTPIPGVFFSKLVWLTFVSFTLLTVYHGIAALLALKPLPRDSKLLDPFHFCATAIIASTATVVPILFWGLYAINPDLVIDERAKPFLSVAWFNHSLHTFTVVGMFIDFVLWRHPRPKRSSALKATFIFSVLYTANVHIVYYTSGFWAYPILGELNFLARGVFMLVCTALMFASFLIADTFNSLLQPRKTRRA